MNIFLNVVGGITPPSEYNYDETRVNIVLTVLLILIITLLVLLIRYILINRKHVRKLKNLQNEHEVSVQESPYLSPDEQQLLADYRTLNDIDKLSIKETILAMQKEQLISDRNLNDPMS